MRGDRGSMTIEFALWFPIFVAFICGTTELGLIAARHARLEFGVDAAVRMVQLETENEVTHATLVQTICDTAAIIPNCTENIMLEMRSQDLRDRITMTNDAECTNRAEEVNEQADFDNGDENELMVLRACVKFAPVFPTTGIASSIKRDSAGDYSLISIGAYVQEPM